MATSLGALQKVNEPGAGAGETRKVNVLAYFDSASLTAPTQYIDYTDKEPCPHIVTPDDMILPGDEKKKRKPHRDPEDSASVRSILSFVQWCIKERRATADNYVLIFSGHSFGFYGTSFMRDQSSGRFLSLRMFRYALEEACKKFLFPEDWNGTKVSKGGNGAKERRKIAIVGFDSCDMGMVEVGYELKQVANTVVASAGNVPNAGWGYAPMLRYFVENSSTFPGTPRVAPALAGTGASALDGKKSQTALMIDTPPSVQKAARAFVDAYVQQQQSFAIGGNSVDMAALDLDEIDPLAKRIGALGAKLSDMLGLGCLTGTGDITEEGAMVHNRTKSLLAGARLSCQSYMHEQAVDIRDFCQKLILGCREISHETKYLAVNDEPFKELQKICESILTAAEQCILQAGYSGDEYQFSKGISLYFPWTALTYLFTWDVYGNLRFSCGDYDDVAEKGKQARKVKISDGPGEGWDDFLLFYLYIVTLRSSEPADHFETSFKNLDQGSIVNGEWQQTRANWIATRDKRRKGQEAKPSEWPKSSRENWRTGTRENWPVTGTRENWPVTGTRENWPRTGARENPLVTGTRHDPLVAGNRGIAPASDYMTFFGRTRNFILDWKAKGMWPKDETAPDDLATRAAGNK